MDRDKAGYGRKMERLFADARGPQRRCLVGRLLIRLNLARVGVVGPHSEDLGRQQRRLSADARGP